MWLVGVRVRRDGEGWRERENSRFDLVKLQGFILKQKKVFADYIGSGNPARLHSKPIDHAGRHETSGRLDADLRGRVVSFGVRRDVSRNSYFLTYINAAKLNLRTQLLTF